MAMVASLLFLSALVISGLAIARTVKHAMPRIVEIIENELEPVVLRQRRVIFGTVRVHQRLSADVVTLSRPVRVEQQFKVAA